MNTARWIVCLLVTLLPLLVGCAAPAATEPVEAASVEAVLTPTAAEPAEPTPTEPQPTELPPGVFFDDFNYDSQEQITANGWTLREQPGWPGVPGATFRSENVSFVDEAVPPGNRVLRMSSSTDGSAANTFQTQICHKRKYLEGTYAARVYFHDEPAAGPDGDQVVETFYSITPYETPLDPNYSEMDFEYLPNGGWSWGDKTFMFTTWETVQIEPWQADNASDSVVESQDGWRTLVAQVNAGTVRYYISGKLGAQHSGNYYPDAAMSINFNLWFVNGGLLRSSEARTYNEEIDWVFYQQGLQLSPEQVNKQVRLLRESGVYFTDNVPEMEPALSSPCDL